MTETESKVKLRTFELVIGILLTIGLGLATWNLQKTLANAEQIVEIKARMPVSIPPDWFRRQVEANTAAIKELATIQNTQNRTILERLHRIEQEVTKLASKKGGG